MYSVVINPKAAKQLAALPAKLQQKILGKMEALAVNPYAPNNNVKALNGGEGYRLRVGDYRVIYDLHDDVLHIELVRVGHRREVYQ